MYMKRLFVIIICCSICFFYSCNQDVFEDTSLEKTSVASVNDDDFPFDFSLLFPTPNEDPSPPYLSKNQSGMVDWVGQNLMNSNFVLSRMAFQLHRSGIVLHGKIDPKLNKEAVYNSREKCIIFKSEQNIVDSRIILHELLHAFQTHLAGKEFTPQNEGFTEFEVYLMYDVFEYLMYGRFAQEGGNTESYKQFVMDIAKFRISAIPETIPALVERFEKHYRVWGNVKSDTKLDYYLPSLLIYFLNYKWAL